MRKLTEEQLDRLDRVVEDDVLYLVYRDKDTSEKLYRLTYPSHEQRLKAEAIRQSYYWQLRKQGDLKTREEVEAEFADELKELRGQLSVLRKEGEKLKFDYFELMGQTDMPDIEVDKKAFNEKALELAGDRLENADKQTEVIQRMNSILANSIDFLSRKRYFAAVAAMCWERKVDGQWKVIWGDFEEFRNEGSPLATVLETDAAIMMSPGADFFDSLPSRTSGGNVTSTPSQDSENSSPEQ